MKRLLACLAVSLWGGQALAQVRVDPVPDFDGCMEFRVSNPTDRTYSIRIDYQYFRGTDFQGQIRDWVWQTNSIIQPRSTVTVPKAAVPFIDCKRGWERFNFQPTLDDITSKREDIDRSREDVIRRQLEAEAERRRQADEAERRRLAEAEARQRAAADQQAARDAAQKRAAELGQMQADNAMQAVRQRIDAGDRRCQLLVMPTDRPEDVARQHAECLRRIESQTGPTYTIGPVDPVTCGYPKVMRSSGTAEEAEALARDVAAKQDECRRARDGIPASVAPAFAGPDPAMLEAERIRAQQAEAQRQFALEREARQRQLDAQAAALEAERQAMLRANAQQSITQSANDLRNSNADFARQSQDIRDANDELQRWLDGN